MKILKITQYIFLLAIIALFGFYTWSTFYPFKVVDIKGLAIMEKQEYYVGDNMSFVVKYCKYMSIPGTVYPELVDTVVYNLRSMASNASIGCGEKIMNLGRTPDVASGIYHIHMRTIYKVNEIRNVEVSFETNDFKIKSNEK